MKEMKRILAIFLCLVMLVGVMPVSAFATEDLGGFFIPGGDKAASEDGSLGGFVIPGGKVEAEETTAPAEEETTAPAEEETTAPSEEETTAPTEEEDESEEETLTEEEVSDEAEQLAANETIYILAGGDFQETGDHSKSAENVTILLGQISQKYKTMDGFLFVGDYDCDTHDNATETANGIDALMTAVQGVYSSLNHDNSVLVQGNHDTLDSRIDATGGHDFANYAVFVLNESDYPDYGGTESGVKTLAANLETWLNKKLGEGYDAPIFVVSHLPLAFGPRTNRNGDGKYAKFLFDVMNQAAANGLNLFFLHGHDHAYGYDNYLGGEAIFLKKGDKINIAEVGSQTAWTEETLNFTYMNAGYVGYYNESGFNGSGGDDKLSMTVFAITDSQVTVERYGVNGLCNLKSAGRLTGDFTGNVAVTANTTVYTSPQTVKLTAATVDTGATIGEYIAVTKDAPADDVTTSNKGWVELIAPTPDTPEVPATPESTKYVYTLDTDGTVTDKADAEQGYLIVDSSNASAMTDRLGSTGVTIADNAITLDAQPDYEWWITADGKITDGTNYLKFTGSTSWGSPSGSVSVVTNASQATAWEISHSQNGQYTISCDYSYSSWGSTRTATYYLRYDSNAFSVTSSSNTVRLFSGAEVTTPGTEGTPAVPGKNGTYGKIVGDLTYNATVGMTADEAMAGLQTQIDGYYYDAMTTPGSDVTGTKGEDSVLTWQWVDTFNGNVAGDYEVAIKYGDFLLGTAEVIVEDPNNTTYYIAEGNGLYIVDMNATADEAMAAVMEGVAVSSATDANGANKNHIPDEEVTWNWVDTFDGTNIGPYTMEVMYDGTSLGTVEVKVNVQYDTEIKDWTYVGDAEGTHTYTLDTNGLDYGTNHKYLIVGYLSSNTDGGYDYALTANGSNTGAVKVDISGNTATVDTRDYEWYFATGLTNTGSSTYNTFITQNGTTWLYHTNSSMYVGNGSDAHRGYWSASHRGNGVYRFGDQDGATWYLRYSLTGNKFTVKNSTSSNDVDVRLYKYTSSTPGGAMYVKLNGATTYTVASGTTATSAMNKVKAGITAYVSSNADGSNAIELADSELKWTWKNNYNGKVDGSYWIEISYNGTVLGIVEVVVQPAVVNNYPSYPNEGSVKVNKTGTGIDFQSSGIARVEVSASGVPVKKGIDIVIVVDTSSSMTNNKIGSKTRLQVLQESMESMIDDFNKPGADGTVSDIDIAIMDFNGYGTEYANLYGTETGSEWSNTDHGKVYTGDGTFGSAGAFVDCSELLNFNVVNQINETHSGTNYDGGLKRAYRLLEAKTTANMANNEVRDQYVIFLSDGAPFGWNGIIESDGDTNEAYSYYWWNKLLQGEYESLADMSDAAKETHGITLNTRFEFLYDGNGTTHPNRWAEAIKGDPKSNYTVLDTVEGSEAVESDLDKVAGLGATIYSIGFGLAEDSRTVSNFKGAVTVETMTELLQTLASEDVNGKDLYWPAQSADDLSTAFKDIVSSIQYAAYNARYVDQMGHDYDLQLKTVPYEVKNADNTTTQKTLAPVIEILSYDIYTKAEADEVAEGTEGDTVTNAMIGTRKGTSKVLEKVTFNTDGTEAYSTLSSTGPNGTITAGENILIDGVIYANTFWYNSTASGVAITGVDIPTGLNADGTTSGSTNVLPAETFYWKLGTVQTSELAMRYYVFLTDSMDEPGKDAGSYPTNEYATLYYDNYLQNPCKKETVSPVLAWEAANVSYAFYLVNAEGQPVNMNGEVVPFAERVIIVKPTLYKEVRLNTTGEIDPLEVISKHVLPDGYALYDEKAQYSVQVNSSGTGSWTILQDKEPATTYVTDFSQTEQYSNEISVNHADHDYTHTVVWFAVKWEPQALPDTVVIDYGLPVDIHVMVNDMFGDYGKLVGVAAGDKLDEVTSSTNGVTTTSATGTFGSAKVQVPASGANASNSVVRYELNKDADLTMNDAEVFTYSVKYANTNYEQNNGYYYSTITVIPATTIYYEDDFVDLSIYNWSGDVETGTWVKYTEGTGWTTDGQKNADATQDEDRPDDVNYAFDTVIDANNVYGYDSSYTECSKYSLGSAAMVNVNYDKKAEASFTFYGTGFDVISLTSNQTGTIIVDVINVETGKSVHSYVVDTYFGYQYIPADKDGEEGKWQITVDANGDNVLYQVPVIKVNGLEYRQYKAVITAQYSPAFDHEQYDNATYDFYLDAIRIYDPAGVVSGEENEVIEDAYSKDNEGWPFYQELRNNVIDAVKLDETTGSIAGIVFVDGVGDTAAVADYETVGPNNELYLKPGQAIMFTMNPEIPDTLASLQIGLKCETGDAASYYIFGTNDIKKASDLDALAAKTLSTGTDMYYDITELKDATIVIYNDSESGDILTVTNLKATFTAESKFTGSLSVIDKAEVEKFLTAINTKDDGTVETTPPTEDGDTGTGSEGVTDELKEIIKSIVDRLKGLFGKG